MTKRWLAVLLTAVLLVTALTACSFDFLKGDETEDATTTTTETPTTTTTAVVYPVCYVTATKLNVRREPTTEGELLGQLVYGTAVEVLETANGWCRIDYNGAPAYVSATYLSIQKPPSTTTTTAAPTAAPTLAANTTVYVTANKLNVRRKPAVDGPLMGQILYGTEVVSLETVDGWCRIEYQGETAYISMDYVSLTPPPTTTTAAKTTKAD